VLIAPDAILRPGMTLNITVVTPRCIYQSADYRLLDLQTGNTYDFQTQKIFPVNCFRWSATVCFSGVGRTHDLDVSDWLNNCLRSVGVNEPFDRLLDELMKANEWLSAVSPPHNKHSFSIGAFIGSEPVFALISNFEQLSGPMLSTASPQLSKYVISPRRARTFVSGQRQAVKRHERKRLSNLAMRDPEPQQMYNALVELNREVATRRTTLVSPACFTTHLRLTGDGGGQAHGIDGQPLIPKLAMPPGAEEIIAKLIDEQFGPGRAQIRSISFGRADESDDYYEVQLREKPNDANTHCNYGAFLHDKKKDVSGAERAYRKALEIDSTHVNALGNLANVMWETGNHDQAEDMYRRALTIGPGHENVTWNYARFLRSERNDLTAACGLLDAGIIANPDSSRLVLLRAELKSHSAIGMSKDGRVARASEALEDFRRAREKGAPEADVELGYAYALQMSGAPIGACIASYRAAIALNPRDGNLKLNLAQLLFVKCDNSEGNKLLQEALRIGLDDTAQLEAEFYLVAHTSADPQAVFQKTKSLLARGVRLGWDVQSNLDVIGQCDEEKATLLESVVAVMKGEQQPDILDHVLDRWRHVTP
jgi:tetratricopeptide (TPR) repeat protein